MANDKVKQKEHVYLDADSAKKRLTVKAALMFAFLVLFVLFMLSRAIYSLKEHLFGNRNQNKAPETAVIIDKQKLDIPVMMTSTRTKAAAAAVQQSDDDDEEDTTVPTPYPYTPPAPAVTVIKSLGGIAKTNTVTGSSLPASTRPSESSPAPATSTVVKATFSTLDFNLAITRGTIIKCTLTTDLISQVSGGIGCMVINDVYSENGTTLLIEKGSKVIGAYRRSSLAYGDNRIFVLWEEIRTPHGVQIAVNSGASDTLGGQGVEGYVDNHFWTRFGNAILVSMITDISTSAATQIQKKDTYSNFNNTIDSSSDVVKSIIEKNIDIPPTIYRNHGDVVAIYLNQDIDFRDVYKLEYQ